MTNGPSIEAVALASKAYEDAPCWNDAEEWHDWVNAIALAVDAHTEALRTRLAACEDALRKIATEDGPGLDGSPGGKCWAIATAALKETA